ncbi:MetS family NSS transporter small subunit [Oleidesulfovibrio sp.]
MSPEAIVMMVIGFGITWGGACCCFAVAIRNNRHK